MVEKQNKEIKVKLEEIDKTSRAKAKAAIAALELKGINLEEQLLTENQERMLAAKANSKLEKKIKERFLQLEDEQEEVERDKAETEEDEDHCVIDEDEEEEAGEVEKIENRLSDTDPHGSFGMIEVANTARGYTKFK